MTDNLPPNGGDAFWDRWHGPEEHGPEEHAGAAAADPAAQVQPVEPTQPIPTTEPSQQLPPLPPPSQARSEYAAPDAYQSGDYPHPGTWQSGPPQSNAAQPYPGTSSPGQPYPGQPYPGQPYGQPYPAQPYAGQQYPPGQAWVGQQPGYPQQPYAGSPVQKPKRTGLFILLGVVGLCVALVVGTLLLRPGASTTGAGTTGTGRAPTSGASGGGTPTVASTASEAVAGYIGALAAGDAATALAYAAQPPLDTALLSNDVLAAGNAIAPITDIAVETPAGSAGVHASYTIGSDAVEATFAVVDTPTGWKLQQVASQVSVDRLPEGATLGGIPVPSGDSLTLFPGSYRIGTADDRYQLTGGSFVVESPTDTASVTVVAKLSSSGVAAVRSAARKHLSACLSQHKAQPSTSCGYGVNLVERGTGKKIKPRTVRWRVTAGTSTLGSFSPSLDASDPAVARGRVNVRLRVDITATNGQRYWSTATISSVAAAIGSSVQVRFNE